MSGSLYLPKNIKNIKATCFAFVSDIKTIRVSTKNKYLSAKKGVLFTKNKKKLIYYPKQKKSKTYKIPSTVTKISALAFFQNAHIKKVVLPKQLSLIGSGAFAGCNHLQNINLTKKTKINQIRDFDGSKLKLYYISDYTDIGVSDGMSGDGSYNHGTFEGTALTSIIIPDRVTYLGSNTFKPDLKSEYGYIEERKKEYTHTLQHIYIGKSYAGTINSNKTIDKNANVYETEKSLPLWLLPLKTITVSSQNTKYRVKDNALYSKDLKTLYQVPTNNTASHYTIDSPTTNIAAGAFSWITNISDITISGKVNSIGYCAFTNYMCNLFVYDDSFKLTKVTVHGTVKKVYPYAFQRSGALTDFQCKGIQYIDDGAFSDCTKLKNVPLGDNLSYIGYCAFYNCYTLKEIILPNNLKQIGKYAFGWCSSLSSVSISQNTNVDPLAFYGCPDALNIIRR